MKKPTRTVLLYYLKLGFHHIIPGGLDHILFVSALCLFSNKIKPFWQATAFTVAHSANTALSMKNIIVVPSAITEPIIAMSIVFVAVEKHNVFGTKSVENTDRFYVWSYSWDGFRQRVELESGYRQISFILPFLHSMVVLN